MSKLDGAQTLASAMLTWDECYPGDPGAEVVVDPLTWSDWLKLCREIKGEQTGDANRAS